MDNLPNCLAYALRFWKKYPRYKLFYNSDHVINSPNDNIVRTEDKWHYRPLEEYGYDHISKGYNHLLDDEEKSILREYFKK